MANHNEYELNNTWLGYFISQYLVAKPHACTNVWILFDIFSTRCLHCSGMILFHSLTTNFLSSYISWFTFRNSCLDDALQIFYWKPCFKSRPQTVLVADWTPECSDHCRFSSGAVFFMSVRHRCSKTRSSLAVLHMGHSLLGLYFRLPDYWNFFMIILAVVWLHLHLVAIWQ